MSARAVPADSMRRRSNWRSLLRVSLGLVVGRGSDRYRHRSNYLTESPPGLPEQGSPTLPVHPGGTKLLQSKASREGGVPVKFHAGGQLGDRRTLGECVVTSLT